MPNWGVAKGGGGILGQLRDCSEFLVRGGGVWAMAGVQGKVAFGLSHFCIEVFQKKVIGLQIPMKIPT